MANLPKIKDEFKATVVGFGGSGLPLGQRSEADLLALATMAQYDKHIANYFEVLPSAQELKEQKENNLLKDHPAPAPDNKTRKPREGDNAEVK